MRIALIEDEAPKRDAIAAFIVDFFQGAEMLEAKSVRSARSILKNNELDLVFLDMSLPTFDVTELDTGGRPQGLGGIEVIRYMYRDNVSAPVVVITGYQEFTEQSRYMTLDQLRNNLEEEFSEIYRGLVTFNALSDKWESDLRAVLNGVLAV